MLSLSCVTILKIIIILSVFRFVNSENPKDDQLENMNRRSGLFIYLLNASLTIIFYSKLAHFPICN